MLKFTFIIITAYIIYYSGNIVYDLFLRKDKKVETEEQEEFSLGDFVESERNLKQVGIEDVENVNTPESFIKNESFLQKSQDQNQDEKPEIEELRKKFEAEQEISVFNLNDDDNNYTNNIKTENSKQIKPDWKELLKLSETTVQMVANYEGQKVYHSII